MCIQYYCPICNTPYIGNDSISHCRASTSHLLPPDQASRNQCPFTTWEFRAEGQHPSNAQCDGTGQTASSSIEARRSTVSSPPPKRRKKLERSQRLPERPSLPDTNRPPPVYARPGDLFNPQTRSQVQAFLRRSHPAIEDIQTASLPLNSEVIVPQGNTWRKFAMPPPSLETSRLNRGPEDLDARMDPYFRQAASPMPPPPPAVPATRDYYGMPYVPNPVEWQAPAAGVLSWRLVNGSWVFGQWQ